MKKLIISTDCGVDDALALVAAFSYDQFDILGLTTVFGNITAKQAAENCIYIKKIMGKPDIPVVVGSEQPLFGAKLDIPPDIHGVKGLGNFIPEVDTKPEESITAAEFMIKTLESSIDNVTVVSLGPLTDIALALKLKPSIIDRIEEIIIMGGAAEVNGNISPSSEANIANDAAAAEIVFQSGAKCVVVGLDVTTKIVMTPDYMDRLADTGSTGKFLHSIYDVFYEFHKTYFKVDGIYPHDLTALYYAIDKTLFRTYDGKVYAETEGTLKGLTYVDRDFNRPNPQLWNWTPRKPAVICKNVDSKAILKQFIKLIH